MSEVGIVSNTSALADALNCRNELVMAAAALDIQVGDALADIRVDRRYLDELTKPMASYGDQLFRKGGQEFIQLIVGHLATFQPSEVEPYMHDVLVPYLFRGSEETKAVQGFVTQALHGDERARLFAQQAHEIVPAVYDQLQADTTASYIAVKTFIDIGAQPQEDALQTVDAVLAFMLTAPDVSVGGGNYSTVLEQRAEAGEFDDYFAADLVRYAVESRINKYSDVKDFDSLLSDFDIALAYSKDELEPAIERFGHEEVRRFWSAPAQQLFERFKLQKIAELQASIEQVERYTRSYAFVADPIDGDDFMRAYSKIAPKLHKSRFAQLVVGENMNGALQHARQTENRQRRMLGNKAVDRFQKTGEKDDIHRDLLVIKRNGQRYSNSSDPFFSMVDEYLSAYDNDAILGKDVQNVFDYLGSKFDTTHGGVKGINKLTNGFITFDGKQHPVYRLKPKYVPHLQVKARESVKMRGYFIVLETGDIGVMTITDKNRAPNILKNEWGLNILESD